MSTTIMQCLTFIVSIVCDKIATWKVLPYTDNRPAGRPSTDHYIDTRFSCESSTVADTRLVTSSPRIQVDSVCDPHHIHTLASAIWLSCLQEYDEFMHVSKIIQHFVGRVFFPPRIFQSSTREADHVQLERKGHWRLANKMWPNHSRKPVGR